MATNETTIQLNPETDPLAQLEARIRGDGAWCRVAGKFNLRHKMVCKREKSSIAISRCGQIIVPFDKLVEDDQVKQCLVCALYDMGSEEVKLTSEKTLKKIVDDMETKP